MFKNKKRAVIFTVIVLVVLGLIIQWAIPYRFGYFTEGPKLAYEHFGDVLKLDNGNVLLLGSNSHTNPHKDNWNINELVISEVPSEIYNAESNNFEIFKLPNTIAYKPKGILLGNNKLLLTSAYNHNDKKYPKYGSNMPKPYPYDSIALINLDTNKVEKMLQKKLNRNKKPSDEIEATLLDNGNVLLVEPYNGAELYNPKLNTSVLLKNWNFEKGSLIPDKEGRVLIFCANTENSSTEEYANVYEFDTKTQTFKSIGKTLRRINPLVMKINNNEILLMGSANWLRSEKLIEIYDTRTNTSRVVANFIEPKKRRTVFYPHKPAFAAAATGKSYILITGGTNGSFPLTKFYDSIEVLNTKTGKIYKGPKMKRKIAYHKMIKLNNGNLLVVGNGVISNVKYTQIFKENRGKLWTTTKLMRSLQF